MTDRVRRGEFEVAQVRVRELQQRDALVEAQAEAAELERAIAQLEASLTEEGAQREALEARRLEAQALSEFNRNSWVERYQSEQSENQVMLRWFSVPFGGFALAFALFKLEQALRHFDPLGLVNVVPLGIGVAFFARDQWLKGRAHR
jgi:multidrug efflux pump subunit AcrA (membrane-fusion protein)